MHHLVYTWPLLLCRLVPLLLHVQLSPPLLSVSYWSARSHAWSRARRQRSNVSDCMADACGQLAGYLDWSRLGSMQWHCSQQALTIQLLLLCLASLLRPCTSCCAPCMQQDRVMQIS